MKAFLLFSLLMIAFYGFAQQSNTEINTHYIKHMKDPSDKITQGFGPLTQNSRELTTKIKTVHVTHGIRYQITNSSAGDFVTIVAEENIMPFVQMIEDGDYMSFALSGSIESDEGILIIMNNKNLSDLLVKDGAEGEVLLTECENVSITVMGGSDMKLKGSTEELDLFVKGGSNLDGRKFHVAKGNVAVKGASETTIAISESLKAHSENGSVLIYFGNPEATTITEKLDGKVFHRESD
ncbi:MAG: hypothetical protein HKN09_03825 [Saprospiraceae bacterium]|nr:hypothetical protein [Saprospiraceae bacterium]